MKMRKNKVVYRFLYLLTVICLFVWGLDGRPVSADETDTGSDIVASPEDTELEEYEYGDLRYYVDTEDNTAALIGSISSSLKTLTVPDTIVYEDKSIPVTSIEDYAFEGSSLTSAKLGANVKEIGEGAFAFSDRLKSVTIPKKCTKVGDAAFLMCSSLSKVTVNKKAKLKTIGNGAFAATAITGFTVPNATVSIGDAAFSECGSLKKVTLGTKLKSIGEGAFAGCTALDTVSKVSGNKYFEIEDNIIYTAGFEELVCGAAALGEYKIKDGTQSVKARAFEGNEGLTMVEIPDSVIVIGECAFMNCSGLVTVTVMGGIKETEGNIFYGCESLELIRILYS